MKTSVISRRVPPALPVESRRSRRPSKAPRSCSTGRRIITTGSTIRRSRSREETVLFMRGAGPIGYPGARRSGEHAPARLPHHARASTRCRASATGASRAPRGSPSILNASPEAAAMGGLALAADRRPGADRPAQGDGRRADPGRGTGTAPRRRWKRRAAIPIRPRRRRGRKSSARLVGQMDTGAILEGAEKYQRIAQTKGLPRDNH